MLNRILLIIIVVLSFVLVTVSSTSSTTFFTTSKVNDKIIAVKDKNMLLGLWLEKCLLLLKMRP